MKKRPIIGIAYSDSSMRDNEMRLRTYVSRKYYRAIYRVGGLPVLLPSVDPKLNRKLNDSDQTFPENYDHIIDNFLEMVDGVIIPGGEDVHPRYQGEDPHPELDLVNPFRDEFELAMVKAAFSKTYRGKKLPLLGICRGIQVLAIALGGEVHQDISDVRRVQHSQKSPRWETSHKISIENNSKLSKILGQSEIFTNSFHHQAVRKVPDQFNVVASTSDGIVEAIEFAKDRFIMGVQWHPEETFDTDVHSQKLFKALVEAAASA
ncbi:MAG: putative glutamine amidotransferase [Clostridiales bacterium]|jgi:putative glutamine amidotransferase|nr:putative glutamine amidotransferase [Clostridiales bacterium]MDN5283190.1 putative glutamine amidotransferase [Candidatus Ozemobacter sp.]